MPKEVKLMSTVLDREKVRHFGALIETIESMEDSEKIALNISDFKAFLNVMRDYAVMTHLSDSDSEIATALSCVADYVDQASTEVTKAKPTFYKTTKLAEIFDVSVTAINKWIDEGRFIGYRRPEPGKHARIPHFTPFRLRDGSVVPLGKLIDEYSGNPAASFADDDERQLLHNELRRLQDKYETLSYDEAFGGRVLSPSEESDASWWNFYERKLSELNNG
ncbi:hypothetical protein [Paenibacillus xylaniclasticus]|uniref:hypothetical protein n=1 Tax=Paenibacillus xylaniclasticus TaxID=588083 RepID=UPI000FD7567B|nr:MULTISPECIES: hypothetical protein [Paenibacillus]GFN32947.1 hypothetical protein PCURB6_32070 [Paenibacillus curdlanolyticus]